MSDCLYNPLGRFLTFRPLGGDVGISHVLHVFHAHYNPLILMFSQYLVAIRSGFNLCAFRVLVSPLVQG